MSDMTGSYTSLNARLAATAPMMAVTMYIAGAGIMRDLVRESVGT